jgi:hypothetical protein
MAVMNTMMLADSTVRADTAPQRGREKLAQMDF